MGTQDIALIVIGSVLAFIYLLSRMLEEDCKRLKVEMETKSSSSL